MKAFTQVVNSIHGGAEVPITPGALTQAARDLVHDPSARHGSLAGLLTHLATWTGMGQVRLKIRKPGQWTLPLGGRLLQGANGERTVECTRDPRTHHIKCTTEAVPAFVDRVDDDLPLDDPLAEDHINKLAQAHLAKHGLKHGEVSFSVDGSGKLLASTPRLKPHRTVASRRSKTGPRPIPPTR
jgi:hypothetical protein